MIFKPYLYQDYLIQRITDSPKLALFVDMGLGKTVSTLTAILGLMYDRFLIKKVLIIAPLNVARYTWDEEIEKWDHLKNLSLSKVLGSADDRLVALQQNADIYVINRENVNWLIDVCIKNKSWKFDFLVVDESSSFKDHTANRFKGYTDTNARKRHFGLKHVAPRLKRVLLLTGTPSPNGLMDLWSQIYLLDQGKRLGTTITSFRKKYFYPERTNGNVVYKWGLKPGADKLIHDAIRDISVSLEAKDHIKMPERIDNFIRVHLDDLQKALYKKLLREKVLDIRGKKITAASAGVLANKLLQLANGTIYDDKGDFVHVHDAKLDALEEIVEASVGKPIIVFYGYQHDRVRILKRFKALDPRELNDEKDKEDWDAGRIRLLVAHPDSMGHGLNMQSGGCTIVWFCLTWSLELYLQANARLYRQGQKETVVINHLFLEDSIDEDVITCLKNKQATQQDLIDALKARIKEGRI